MTNTSVQVERHDTWSIEVAIMVIITAVFFETASEKNHTVVWRALPFDGAQCELEVLVLRFPLLHYDKFAITTPQNIRSVEDFLQRPKKTGGGKQTHTLNKYNK